MDNDWLAQLSQQAVPPPPASLERNVHQRVNRWLLGTHALELATRAAPEAVGQLAVAFAALARFTLTGKFPPTDPKQR